MAQGPFLNPVEQNIARAKFLANKIVMNPTLLSQSVQGRKKPSENKSGEIFDTIEISEEIEKEKKQEMTSETGTYNILLDSLTPLPDAALAYKMATGLSK